jgi:hypothetical protein
VYLGFEKVIAVEYAGDSFAFAQKIADCPHRARCRTECRFIANERPSPDYIGRRYRGLVVIGANPGVASKPEHEINDVRTFALQERIAEGDRDAFSDLLQHLPQSMLGWRQMVSRSARAYLEYDIEEIAYINLVKCATTRTDSNVRKLFKEKASKIPERCWDTHTRPILEALRPRFIVALWLPIKSNLESLGYRFEGVEKFGAHNGARNLSWERRYEDAKSVFDSFNEFPESDET